MALQVTGLARVFKFKKSGKDITLDDPNPTLSATEVMKHYSGQYGELTNATLTGPTIVAGKATYTFETTAGVKG
jgi:PRTRC genetic system protein C